MIEFLKDFFLFQDEKKKKNDILQRKKKTTNNNNNNNSYRVPIAARVNNKNYFLRTRLSSLCSRAYFFFLIDKALDSTQPLKSIRKKKKKNPKKLSFFIWHEYITWSTMITTKKEEEGKKYLLTNVCFYCYMAIRKWICFEFSSDAIALKKLVITNAVNRRTKSVREIIV